MKKYENPLMNVIKLNDEDVITTSQSGGDLLIKPNTFDSDLNETDPY